MNNVKSNRELKLSVFLLMAGAVLLANPVWGVADILPDLIGWGLIWLAMRGFSEINGEMYLAGRQALYLIAIELGKTLLYGPLQSSEIRSDTLLAVTVVTVGEIWCGMLFFSHFFKGVDGFARSAHNDDMYLKTDNVRFLSALFLWVRGLGTFLPQLTAIPDWLVQYGEIIDDSTYKLFTELAAAEDLLNLVFSVFVIIVAVIWLVSYLPFLHTLTGDHALRSLLSDSLAEDDPLRKLKRRFSKLNMARLCFGLGLIFLLDLHIDGFRFLPLCGFPALFAVGCWFLNSFAEEKRFTLCIKLFSAGAVWFLLAELYRRFFTIWDLRAFGELTVTVELLSAAVMLLGMPLLLFAWLHFSREMDGLSASMASRRLFLDGLPYFAFALYAAVYTVIFTLPVALRELNTPRVLLVVLIWLLFNRRLAAFEEISKRYLSEHMENKNSRS